MALSVGRVSSSHLTGLRVVDTRDGDITIEGKVGTADPVLCHAVASQIVGLSAVVDDPTVPVQFSGDHARFEHLNGFYRVAGSSVGLNLNDRETWGRFPWSINLEPLPDRSEPMVETRLDGGFRANSVGQTAANSKAWFATPGPVWDDADGDMDDIGTMNTATGTVRLCVASSLTGTRRRLVSGQATPESWMRGACTVEHRWGSTWLPTVGRSLPAWGATRVTNGIIRVTLDGLILTFERWKQSTASWVSSRSLQLTADGADNPVLFFSPVILANSPEEVRLRVMVRRWTFGDLELQPAMTFDIRLRRGGVIAECSWAGRVSELKQMLSPTGPWTTITGARYETTQDANNNRFMHTFPVAAFATTTRLDMGLGYHNVDDQIAGLGNVIQITDRYFAPLFGRSEFVGR